MTRLSQFRDSSVTRRVLLPFLNRLRANKITPAAVLSAAIRSPAGEMLTGRVTCRWYRVDVACHRFGIFCIGLVAAARLPRTMHAVPRCSARAKRTRQAKLLLFFKATGLSWLRSSRRNKCECDKQDAKYHCKRAVGKLTGFCVVCIGLPDRLYRLYRTT